MTTGFVHTLSDVITSCAAAYKVNKAYLFGSYARDDADESSDVDICIEYDDGFTLFSLGGLAQHLEKQLGLPVDVVCGENSFFPKAKERYLRDRVLVYERS